MKKHGVIFLLVLCVAFMSFLGACKTEDKKENYETGNVNDYIKAIITNEEPVYDAIGQIRRIYPNTLKLEIRNSKTAGSTEKQTLNIENIKKKSELELFCDFYKSQNNVDLNENETEIIKNIISEVKHETN